MCDPSNPFQILRPPRQSGTDARPRALAAQQDNPPPGRRLVSEKKSRRKLWELPHKLHCPVVGTCLDIDELRKLGRRAGCGYQDTLNDYELHIDFVANADEKNTLSLRLHKALDKKYAGQVRRFAKAKSNQQLADLWRMALACGEAPGGLWATVTHPKCDDALGTRVYGEIHMLSHQIGAGQRADLKRLSDTRAELARCKKDFDGLSRRSNRQLQERDGQIHELAANKRRLDARCSRLLSREQALRQHVEALRSSAVPAQVTALQAHVDQQAQQLQRLLQERDRWRHSCEASEDRNRALQAEHREKIAECTALERLLDQSAALCDGCPDAAAADCPDLRGQRILCVGGRSQLIGRYRALVDRCNGRLDHHDGGVEDNRQRLETMLCAADAVFCATDCVSHDAYHRLKRFCKRQRKPHVFLRSSGLSAFARALGDFAG